MKEIKSREGMYLTQANQVGDDRLFITSIKGEYVREEDWREATEEEKQAYEREQQSKQLADESTIM
ncbi:MAG: hypothetical protein J6V00_03070 [Bacteroidaceae bacterium]|nr:hypothetical protein [Bacteroidaceae bacterium]